MPTSGKNLKQIISPSKVNLAVREGKLGTSTFLNSPEMLKEVCFGMFCLDVDVVFIHSKQVFKTGPSTMVLPLSITKWVIVSVNPEFTGSDG